MTAAQAEASVADAPVGGPRAQRRRTGRGPKPAASQAPAEAITRKQIRGSGLLLVGRGLSSALKFGAEIVVVRYLATAQYGAWTYALAAVTPELMRIPVPRLVLR